MQHDDVSLDNCLKCSDCNTVCPVLTASAAFPGPKHLGPELERLRREGLPCDTEWVEYCLGCHRCDLACPNQVHVSGLIAAAKARHRKPLLRQFRDYWLARPALLGQLLSAAPSLSNPLLRSARSRRAMSRIMKITAERRFPSYARPDLESAEATASAAGRLLFYPGCAIRYNQPGLGRTILALLRRHGFRVTLGHQGCCGIPALANGDARQAKRNAAAAVKAMAAAVEDGSRIVTACPSCGHMLKTAFAGLLAGDPTAEKKAQRIAQATYDMAELLVPRPAPRPPTEAREQGELRLAYHAPCHQLSQGIGRPWYHLLRDLPGVTIEDLDAGCCGMAGTFGFKTEKYAVSMAVGQRLFERIRQVNPHYVVSECATCRMQIEHGTGYKAVHPAEVLSGTYDNIAPATFARDP